MSVSLNKIEYNEKYFIKCYGEKRPIWKYYLRSFLDLVGILQPVEYYNINKRLNFEFDVLKLWKAYKLNVPEVIKKEKKCLYLSRIEGKTLKQIFLNQNISCEIIKQLFEDITKRHKLALEYNEPHLCHIDANLNNILYSDQKIFHVDFEMGRLKEPVEIWMEREISKLLVSLLQDQSDQNRKIILELFIEIYKFTYVIEKLINKKLNSLKRYSKRKKRYSLFDIALSLKKLIADRK